MRIQPDVIKLDRSLVMNLHEDPAKEALIDSFVRFARRTGASVCAEGIETIEELKLLADLDVTYGQGYVLARPAPEWGTVANSVSESLLRSSLRSQGDLAGKDALPESGDQRLEYVSARLSRIHAVEDLEDVFELIAAEVGADAVCLSRWVRAENTVESVVDSTGDDPGARFNLANYPSTAHVLDTGEAVQVLISDPGADLGELALLGRLGYESLLMVPVVCRDERLGLLEAYGLTRAPVDAQRDQPRADHLRTSLARCSTGWNACRRRSCSPLARDQDDLAELAAGLEALVGVGRLLEREGLRRRAPRGRRSRTAGARASPPRASPPPSPRAAATAASSRGCGRACPSAPSRLISALAPAADADHHDAARAWPSAARGCPPGSALPPARGSRRRARAPRSPPGRSPSAPSSATWSRQRLVADGGGHARAGRAAELDGGGAHAARRAVHEQALARPQAAPG